MDNKNDNKLPPRNPWGEGPKPRPQYQFRQHPYARIFGRSFRRVCTGVGAIVVLGLIIALIGAASGKVVNRVPGQMILYVKLDGSFVEHDKGGFNFTDQSTTLRDAVDAIDLAARDNRVKGIVAEWDGGMSDLGQLEELRTAILNFRKSKKFTAIYGEDYADGVGAYYLASAFGQIWVQPMGMVSIPGIRAEMPYGRALLDKVGVEPEFFARGKYKDLFESAELNKMSPATQESLGALVDDLGNTLTAGIGQDRGMTPDQIKAAFNMGIMTDVEAKQMGFIDQIGYRDSLLEGIRQKMGVDKDDEDKLPFYELSHYAKAMRKEVDEATSGRPRVALVYAVGEISSGSAGNSELQPNDFHTAYGTGGKIAGDDLAGNIREAARDKGIKAIVLRVDSPGGSPNASETIRRAIIYAQARGKPVYVSMGAAAASGGYWISTPANKIYALPMTLTGSIGVAGGKVSLQEMWKKIGVTWDGVQVGPNAGLQSFNTPYTPAQLARMNGIFDYIYHGFIERVAEGRHMSIQRADQIAQGRVWSGNQGKTLGLVDQLGGLDMALDDIAKQLHEPDRFHLSIEVLPKPQTPLEKLADLLDNQVRMELALQTQSGLLHMFAPALERMNLVQQNDPALTYEPLQVH
jgi:protease-4